MLKEIRHTTIILKLLTSFLLVSLTACKNSNAIENEKTIEKKQYAPEKNEVTTIILKKGNFKEELLSNGNLVATQKNSLKFEVSGSLNALNYKEGDFVKKGSVLAQLDSYKYKQALTDAQISLKKTLLELEDMLVGRGYDIKKKKNIPKAIYEMASLRSGYTEALQQVKKATHELDATQLKAPFNGKVAAIQYKLHEQVAAGSVFATLLNDAVFVVEFYITESEIHKIKVNQALRVIPFNSKKQYKGTIVSINPIVEKNGTILVKAQLHNSGQLIEGMNVTIRIEKTIPNQFVIPKSAIVLRQNQQILFKVIKGKAYWTYVQTTNENKNYYTVIPNPEKSSASLKVGDSIITTGNLNLAHDSEVAVEKNSSIKQKPSGIKN